MLHGVRSPLRLQHLLNLFRACWTVEDQTDAMGVGRVNEGPNYESTRAKNLLPFRRLLNQWSTSSTSCTTSVVGMIRSLRVRGQLPVTAHSRSMGTVALRSGLRR